MIVCYSQLTATQVQLHQHAFRCLNLNLVFGIIPQHPPPPPPPLPFPRQKENKRKNGADWRSRLEINQLRNNSVSVWKYCKIFLAPRIFETYFRVLLLLFFFFYLLCVAKKYLMYNLAHKHYQGVTQNPRQFHEIWRTWYSHWIMTLCQWDTKKHKLKKSMMSTGCQSCQIITTYIRMSFIHFHQPTEDSSFLYVPQEAPSVGENFDFFFFISLHHH